MSCILSVLTTRGRVPGGGEGKSEGPERQRGSILGGLGMHPWGPEPACGSQMEAAFYSKSKGKEPWEVLSWGMILRITGSCVRERIKGGTHVEARLRQAWLRTSTPAERVQAHYLAALGLSFLTCKTGCCGDRVLRVRKQKRNGQTLCKKGTLTHNPYPP